jgi:two-component system nitrogen regulation response regulator NtrX
MSKKVLIVDDEEGIRESLKLILEDHYDLILAENGPTALDILDKNKDIGLMLMDIKMPKVNGLDVLKLTKEKHSVPVVIVTGYRSVETAAEASKLGACGYIVKPFKSEEILDTVKKNLK